MNGWGILLLVWLALEALGAIILVGRQRPVMTPEWTAAEVALYGFMAFALFKAVGA